MDCCSPAWLCPRLQGSVYDSALSSPQGSIISSPHMRRRATSTRECPSRGHQPIPNSSSLLGTLFGSKRGKSPAPPPQQPQHPTLISHTPHPSTLHHSAQVESQTQAQMHSHAHAQYCHVQQNPPPYHHHHHYHPPAHLQYHPGPGHGHGHHGHAAHAAHSQHPSHSQHAPHHHAQQPGPAPGPSSTKPKHSGISTIV